MSPRDPNTIDLNQQKLRLADDVKFWPVQESGKLVYRLEIPSLHKFFRVGYEEYVFVSLLDGETTAPQACGLAASVLGSRAPTSSSADSIQRWLLNNQLAYLDSDGPPLRESAGRTGDGAEGAWWSRLNPFWMKFPLPGGAKWIQPWAERCAAVFSRRVVLPGCLLIVTALMALVAHWDRFVASAGEVFSPANWLWLLGTWVVLKVVHEMGHAIACHRQGAAVRETGVVLILLAPLVYVDVSSCWRLNSRWARIAVAAAGMYVELIIAAIAVLLWVGIESPQVDFLLRNLIITAGLSTVLFNANALMRFDGYFMLADLIEVPNLYAEGSTAVKRIAKRVVCGQSSPPSTLSPWRDRFATGYGLAALIWRIVICVSLAIAASTMFAGAGIAIALLGVCLWFGQPLKQLLSFMQTLRRQEPSRFARALIVGTSAVLVLALVVWRLPVPSAVTAPAVATYLPETLVRSTATGFVKNVRVGNEQRVQTGELLLELENHQLTGQLRQIEIALEKCEIRLRQAAGQHDNALQLVMRQSREGLIEQMAQLRTQVDGLRVLAPRDGRVIDRQIELKMGTYVREGDPLFWVAQSGDKEIVAVVAQDSIETVRGCIGQPVRIVAASFASLAGRLDRIDPRASDRLPDDSMAATEGGALAVRARTEASSNESSQSYQLLAPHFLAHVELDSELADRIPAGMRLTASFGYRTDPLAARIRAAVRRLWHASLQENR
jgi:putative peptide zinc metalloprotease protein